MTKLLQEIGSVIYQQAAQQYTKQTQKEEPKEKEKNNEKVVDADFKEVKDEEKK